MDELSKNIASEVKRIIEEEIKSGRFSILSDKYIDLIVQIIISEIMIGKIKPENFRTSDQITERKSAELIFIAAPTGAGKDTLVRKVAHDNADKKYVVLNMDIFRHYYSAFQDFLSVKYPDGLKDRDFAIQTNGFSYEIYYTIQRLLLENFPGTNIIITGTIRETDWVEETFKMFKSNPYTQYINKLFVLAVPKNICAFSAIERYLLSIKKYEPGTARYVSSDYYTDTTEKFTTNLGYFEGILNSGVGLIDIINVYKRSIIQNDFNEDTLLYTSEEFRRINQITAKQVVEQIINMDADVGLIKIATLLDKIKLMQEYLMGQGLYQEVLMAIKAFAEKETRNDKIDQVGTSPALIEKYPGCD